MRKLIVDACRCISRQRVWGVPIPVFYDKESGAPLVDDRTISHLSQLFEKHGADAWWSLPIKDLLPAEYGWFG